MAATHLTRQVGVYALTLCGRVVSDVTFSYDQYEATCMTCLKRLAEIEG